MKRILPIIISLLPLLTFGQSMKIAPKQIEPGLNGQTIITRSGVNVLDSLKWTDVSGVPGNLERTSNKVTSLNSPNNTTYPTTQAVISQGFLTSETDPIFTADKGNFLRLDNGSNTGVVSAGNIDLNAILNTSIVHVGGGSPNTPFTSSSGGDVLTKIYRNDHNYVTQFAQEYSNKPKVYIRNSLSSGGNQIWGNWKELLGVGDNISRFNNDAGYYKPSDTTTILATKHDLAGLDGSNIGTSNLEITSPARYLTYKSGVTPAKLTIGDTASITGNYISLSPTNSIIKNNTSSTSIINMVGGINILDSSAIGTNIYSGYNLGLKTGSEMTLSSAQDMSVNSFNFNLTAGGDVGIISSNGSVTLSSTAPIKLSSQYSPVQLYAGSGSPVQISTDGGSNGVNIFTHNVTGFQNYEMPNKSGTVLLDADTATLLATKPDLNKENLQKVTDRDSITSHQIAAKGIWLTDSVGDNHGGYHAAVIIERTVNAATGNLPSHGVRDQTTMKGDNSNGYASFDFRPQISDSLAHATALQFYPYIYSGTHVGDLEGMDVNLWHWNPSAWTAGQVGTYTGLRIESANVTPLGGRYNVVDTSYGVRIQGRSVDGLGSTNPYSLWSVGSDKLFNMGNVAFGTYPKDDGIKLKVKGVTSLDGTVTSSSLSGTGTRMMVADAGGTMGTQSIPTVNNATLTLTTTVYGATNTQTWTSNSATNKNWAVNVAGTDITTGLNVHTGVLTTQSSTGNDDSVQLLSKINDKGYLQPTTGTGVNTGGGFAATAQTEAFNSTYIDLNDGTYTLYIVAGGNPSGGDIKLVDPNEIPDRIIRIVNTSGATGTFINAPIVGLTSSSVTTINSGKYIVIQSVIDPSSGGRMWAQVGGNY